MSTREAVMSHELPDGKKSDLEPINLNRRKALKALGLQYAVYVTPAMTVLLPGKADGHHRPGHTPNCD